MTRDLILEIGAENIPAFYVQPAVDQLRDSLRAWLDESRLAYDSIRATGTPRRLVVFVGGLADRQGAAEEVVTGPPVSKAFDDVGAPTKAAEGFARSVGVSVDALERVGTPKGEYLGFRRRLDRRAVVPLLRERLPALVAEIRFPKAMKWEASGARFARPVRWIVCLYGATPVRFSFADVHSGNRTYGRPWMPGEGAVVKDAADYPRAMQGFGVVVDAPERRERIRAMAQRAATRLGLSIVADDELFTELTFMLENPRVLVGTFPESYLGLPSEVVTTAMRSHQRYVALVDAKGKLVPRFVTFTDGEVLAPADVRRGNERVLNARLADAQFYWNEDVKHGVDALARELDRIVFIEGLGSVGEKWRRMERIALALNERLTHRERADEDGLKRAARLAKFDLASEMIKDGKEFTKLQGLIGSHYARASGEDPAVVAAIREHYQPRTPSDPVPRSTLGAILGAADRIDTICGCFLAGFTPTGSQDPYALRRQANGLIRIVRDEPAVRLDDMIRAAVGLFVEGGRATRESADAALGALAEFFRARCEAFLRDHGVPYDVADAVNPLAWSQPGLALDRAREIARLRGDARFERLITGVKRVGNILAPDRRFLGVDWARIEGALDGRQLAEGVGFSAGRFEDAEEGALHAALCAAVPEIQASEARHSFADVLHRLAGLADPIDGYFDHVLVNCPDPALRDNRHAFLATVYAVFSRYADFSAIVESGQDRARGGRE